MSYDAALVAGEEVFRNFNVETMSDDQVDDRLLDCGLSNIFRVQFSTTVFSDFFEKITENVSDHSPRRWLMVFRYPKYNWVDATLAFEDVLDATYFRLTL